MSASGGPAADNNELRDENRLAWAISAAINAWESGGPRTISEHIAVAIWPLIEADRKARYQEGRQDAADAIDQRRVAFQAQIVADPAEDALVWAHREGVKKTHLEAVDLARGEG